MGNIGTVNIGFCLQSSQLLYSFIETKKCLISTFWLFCVEFIDHTSPVMFKDHIYRMWKVKYSNIWPNQTIVSDQSELTILLCQPMIIYVCSEDDVNWVQWPSTFHILYTWSLIPSLSFVFYIFNFHPWIILSWCRGTSLCHFAWDFSCLIVNTCVNRHLCLLPTTVLVDILTKNFKSLHFHLESFP